MIFVLPKASLEAYAFSSSKDDVEEARDEAAMLDSSVDCRYLRPSGIVRRK